MRIEFAGSLDIAASTVVTFLSNGTFDPDPFIAKGFTHFDVICIGAGGGKGGDYHGEDFNTAGQYLRSAGGEGGGGGFHRIQGLLDALVGGVSVDIGGPGADGTDLLSDATVEFDIPTTDGGDGGVTSFWAGACAASGGIGGSRVYSATLDIASNANGGEGGVGASSSAGGGAPGAYAGSEGSPADPPQNGSFDGSIGEGGGGGAGGVALYPVGGPNYTARVKGTAGGRGSFDPTLSVYGPGGPAERDTGALVNEVIAGYAGGAKATPLNGLRTVYGNSGQQGICVIKVTKE